MVPEAHLRRTENGLVAEGDGWYVVNAREAVWGASDAMGVFTRLGEGEPRFPQLGINIGVLWPGQPGGMYHTEANQEDFLVLAGECILIVEEEERRLQEWDFFHSPPDTAHIMVGAGDGPCVIVAVGSRGSRDIVYPESELAQRYGAGVAKETRDAKEAYAGYSFDDAPYEDGWLPDL
jgi:uncharacterized cupin superfamily protein